MLVKNNWDGVFGASTFCPLTNTSAPTGLEVTVTVTLPGLAGVITGCVITCGLG